MNKKNDPAAWTKRDESSCAHEGRRVDRPWRLALLGGPGVGKGTQAELLSQRLGARHLSTGDVLRAAIHLPPEEVTPAQSSALDFMRRGELVPDDIVLELVGERLAWLHDDAGFLLDGFPRTVVQAESLDDILRREELSLDGVVNYEMDLDQIVSRLAGRRSCPNCHAIFHVVSHAPRIEGICDQCGSVLIQRDDDRPDSIRVRLEVHKATARPLEDYYRKRQLLIPVKASGTAEEILDRTVEILKENFGRARERHAAGRPAGPFAR